MILRIDSLEFSCEGSEEMLCAISGRREAIIYVLGCQKMGATTLAEVKDGYQDV